MSGPRPVGELEINALADGELSGQAADDVRQAIEADAGLRAIADWRDALNGRLHLAYDGTLAEPIAPLTAKLLRTRPITVLAAGMRRWAAAAAIAAAAAGVGYVAGLQELGAGAAQTQFAQLALGAHQIYASEIRHPVEVAGADAEHLGKWLSKRLGVDFEVPDITDAGLTLVGGRLLAEGDRPAGLLMYEDGTGKRVTLYIEHWATGEETSLRHLASGELNAYYWVDRHFACAVSSTIASDKLRTVSERLYAALDVK